MGKILGNLTNAEVQIPGQAPQYSQDQSQLAQTASKSLPSADAMLGPDVLNPASTSQAPMPSKIQKPSFLEATQTGPGGTANAMAPELSTKGKILTALMSGAFGALAGAGQKTVGQGFQAGAELPWEQAHERQQAQLEQAQIQNLPWARMQTQATLDKTKAETNKANAETAILPSKEALNQAQEEALANKKLPDLAELYAQSVQKGDTAGAQKYKQAIQAIQKPVADKPDSPEQQYIDEYRQKHSGAGVMEAEQAYKRDTATPQKDPQQLAVGPDGTVLRLTPGAKVPAGTKSVAKYGEPTPDEQRRADLAGNLNENLNQLEDILTRKPELFGPLAGRWTELKGKFGSNDPDIAALQVIEHQLGMAQISAHGMRSAQGIQGAAQSIMNGLHSGPAAMKGAIQAVRNSVKTFQQDVDTAKGKPVSSSAVNDLVKKYGGR